MAFHTTTWRVIQVPHCLVRSSSITMVSLFMSAHQRLMRIIFHKMDSDFSEKGFTSVTLPCSLSRFPCHISLLSLTLFSDYLSTLFLFSRGQLCKTCKKTRKEKTTQRVQMQINTYTIKLLSKQTKSVLNNLMSCQTQFTMQLKYSKSTHEASYFIKKL